MNDHDRIEAMFEAGRITRQQADQLLAALAESDSAEHEVDEMEQAAGRWANYQASLSQQDDPTPHSQAAGNGMDPASMVAVAESPVVTSVSADWQSEAGEGKENHEPLNPDFKWLEIDTFVGNLVIEVVDGLNQPEVEDGSLQMTEPGARISAWDAPGESTPRSFLDRLFDGIRNSDLEVRLPTDWGVKFDMKAGNIEIDGPVRAVQGRLRAGDLKVSDTGNADVKVAAGEAEVGLRATSGRNRIQVSVGQADVRILPGSSVNVDASVNIGDISAKGLNRNSRGIGAYASGHLGSGSEGEGAALNISVVTGDVTIKVDDHA